MTRKLLLFVRSLFLKNTQTEQQLPFEVKKIIHAQIFCFLFFFLFSFSNQLFAQSGTVTSNNNGNWSDPLTWVVGNNINRTGTVTSSTTSNVVSGTGTLFLTELTVGSVITRQSGTTIGTVASITSNTSLTLTANASNALTAVTYRTVSGPPSPVDNVIIQTNHAVTVNGTFTCASLSIGTSNNNMPILNFSNSASQLTVNGAFTLGGSTANRPATLDMTNGGTLIVNSLNLGNTTAANVFTAGSGTVQLAANDVLPSTIFTNFNNLSVTAGTTTMGVGLNIAGNLSISNGATLNTTTSNYALTFRGNYINAGTFIANASAVTITGTSTQSIAGFSTTGNVSVTKTGGMATLASAVTAGNLSIASGPYLNLGTTSLIHSVNGTLTLGATTASSGSWGGTTSGATNINSTYFASALGKINVSCLNFTKVVPITSVILNTLNKTTSSPSTIAYEDFTSDTPTKLIAGQSYYLSVKGNTDDGSGSNLDVNYYYTAYFDWNNNGTFDTGENYTVGTIRNSTGSDGKVASVYITIPVATAVANIKMRVLGRLGGYSSSSCVTSSTGQGEDYTVTIDAPCSGNLNPGNTLTSATSVCPSAPFNLSLQNTITDGATYSWETSPDNTGSSVWTSAVPAPTNFFGLEQFNGTNPDANIYGVATITGGQLVLTTTTNSTYGAYVIQKTPGSNINAFTVNFDYQIPAGGGGADGFSLSYANDVQNDNAGGESGSGSGIIVQFDTYDNEGVTAGSRVRVLYAGYTLYNSAIDAPSLRPTTGNTPVVLKVDANGKLTLIINNATVVSNLALPAAYLSAVKSSWRFKFAARTGGSNDKHIIDNLLIRYLDVTASGPTYTTSQTAKTYYRVKITCGSSTFYSNPVLVDMTSSTITNMTASSCHNVAFTVTPVDGTNGTVKSGTTYSWPIPIMASGITGGAASSGSPTSITGTLQNSTAGALTAIYTVTPTTAGCVGPTFTLTITVNKTATTPTLGTITQPTCTTSTGSIALSGLPASGTLLQDNGTVVTNITITGPTMTISGLSPATYKFAANNGCVSAYTSSVTIGAANIWNGTTWSYGADPTINDAVDFRGNFTLDQDVNACSCTVSNSANVVIKSKRTLTVTNGVFVVSGTLTFEDSANLMQTTTSNSLNT
ncbi:hypothetical protein IRZ83_19320, partial [Flavobacterium sp. JLP]|uniref:beta strand repeat-containing protein n=1 Tax=Flavobacterium sp. JLP TaxID=2783793 RepID=UPI0019DF27EE